MIFRVPFKLCATYTVQCAACSNIQDVGYDVPTGAALPMPVLPEGWIAVKDMAFCPNHDLKLVVKRSNMEDKEIML